MISHLNKMMQTKGQNLGEIKAVHVADLEDLLERYDQLQDFRGGGAIKCMVCSDGITTDNIGSLKMIQKKFRFACDKPSCHAQLIKETYHSAPGRS